MKTFKLFLYVICTMILLSSSLKAETVTEEWVMRYNGPGNYYDVAEAIAVDADGNVYVTGYSDGDGYNRDYATVKYDGDGNELWAARYNGPGNGSDAATALAVDADGNVYVTGYSWGGTMYDYATVKYDADGNELWAARYSGPGNRSDVAIALAVDADGNVYVTGSSYGAGSYDDYVTVKYDGDGNELWAVRYNGPGNSSDAVTALAVDADGNVYVTGESTGVGTSTDYATVKYDGDGNELWAARYNGPGNGSDAATALAVDADGNVYVAGYSDGDYATVKYDGDGNELWVVRYNGPVNEWDGATVLVAVDADGNVYVTGSSYGDDTSYDFTYYDYTTVKYDGDGNELWVAQYNGPGNGEDAATALAVDADGNVYVTGYSDGDVATVKYDGIGNELWVARYNGLGWEYVNALAVDVDGNVYVTGLSWDGVSDYVTIKYSTESADADGDGYDSDVDCNDTDASINPGATEVCDEVDNNCDGAIDERVTTIFYGDEDADTYGDASVTIEACTAPEGYVSNSDDSCPTEDSTGFDVNSDGCIDSFSGLIKLVNTLAAQGDIGEDLRIYLLSTVKIANSLLDSGNICIAINQLKWLINPINALRGIMITDEAADEVIAYLNSVILHLQSLVPVGEFC